MEDIMKKTYIIAEISCNHNGHVELAYKLIDEAVKVGVDAIKFQTFKASNLISKNAPKAEYQEKNTGKEESQLEMTKNLEISYENYLNLFKYVESKKNDWFSTPFDFESIEFLKNLQMKIQKIPSGEITNLPYLEKIGQISGKKILSTGMANLEEIDEAIKILKKNGSTDIDILHCITEYPTPDSEMQLKTIPFLMNKYGNKHKIGLSDHSEGFEAAIGSVALGAEIVEKHFTLDNNMPGPDHLASADPKVLLNLVKSVRKMEKMLGKPKVEATSIEKKNRSRKKITYSKN